MGSMGHAKLSGLALANSWPCKNGLSNSLTARLDNKALELGPNGAITPARRPIMFKQVIMSILAIVTVVSCAKDLEREKNKANEEINNGNALAIRADSELDIVATKEAIVRMGRVPESKEVLTEIRLGYEKARATLMGAQASYQKAYDRADENDLKVKHHADLVDSINRINTTIGKINMKLKELDAEIANAKPLKEIPVNKGSDIRVSA